MRGGGCGFVKNYLKYIQITKWRIRNSSSHGEHSVDLPDSIAHLINNILEVSVLQNYLLYQLVMFLKKKYLKQNHKMPKTTLHQFQSFIWIQIVKILSNFKTQLNFLLLSLIQMRKTIIKINQDGYQNICLGALSSEALNLIKSP